MKKYYKFLFYLVFILPLSAHAGWERGGAMVRGISQTGPSAGVYGDLADVAWLQDATAQSQATKIAPAHGDGVTRKDGFVISSGNGNEGSRGFLTTNRASGPPSQAELFDSENGLSAWKKRECCEYNKVWPSDSVALDGIVPTQIPAPDAVWLFLSGVFGVLYASNRPPRK